MFDRLLLAYSSGLLAASTPCVIVLIPLCLVRFVRQDALEPNQSLTAVAGQTGPPSPPPAQSLACQLLLFLLGFQLSYIVFGFALSSILTSAIQTGFKLALGSLFVVASVLAWKGKVDPLRLPLVESAFWTGVSFALLLSFNPCTVPFLAALISLGDPAHTLLALLCFGQGLITPALCCVALGSRILGWLESSAFKMEKIKPFTYVLLGFSGLYLLLGPVHTLSAADTAVGFTGLVIALMLVHSATGKTEPTASCRIMPDGQLSCEIKRTRGSSGLAAESHHARHRWRLLIGAAVALAVLLLGASLLYEHELFTHTAAEAMFAEAQKPALAPNAASLDALSVASSIEFESESDTVDAVAPAALQTGRLRSLRRQLTAAAVASEESDATDANHLDQDGLEAPSILSDAEAAAAVAAAAASQAEMHGGVRLSAADLAALAALAEETRQQEADGVDAAGGAKCIDLSLLPPCFQCDLVVALYRLLALAVAAFALMHEYDIMTSRAVHYLTRLPKALMRAWHRRRDTRRKEPVLLY